MEPRRRILAGGIAALIYALITLLSSLPAGSLPTGIPDVIPHGGEFFLLAFFLVQAFSAPGRPRAMASSLLLLAGLGLLDEAHQLAVPGRVFSLLDLLYDTLGSLAGLLAYRFLAQGQGAGLGGRIRRGLGRLVLNR
jgi:VanZ family protein